MLGTRRDAGFTLLELATVVMIIGILAAMILPGFGYLRSKTERTKCIQNLKGLFVAAQLYVQDHNSWPQVRLRASDGQAYASAWRDAYAKYGIGPENWACPSIQRLLDTPDLTLPKNTRIDYQATPFGDGPAAPYKYSRQPWFIERADMHGDGHMIIFANGDVKPLRDVLRDTQAQRPE